MNSALESVHIHELLAGENGRENSAQDLKGLHAGIGDERLELKCKSHQENRQNTCEGVLQDLCREVVEGKIPCSYYNGSDSVVKQWPLSLCSIT